MQTKKIGCKQKTKTCHNASSSLDQLTPSLATSYKLQIMILKSWWTWLMGLIGLVYTKYSQPCICSCPFDIIPFLFSWQILFCLHPIFFVCIMTGFGFLFESDLFVCILSFLFVSYLFCLHPIFFVCILSFLFASYLFRLHPIFFVCIWSFLFASYLFCW